MPFEGFLRLREGENGADDRFDMPCVDELAYLR